MRDFLTSAALLLVLLNPFLLIIYLVDMVRTLSPNAFAKVLIRAGLIAGSVFCIFALLGDAVFTRGLQVEFASFQIFGGILFLLIGIQFVFKGPAALQILRGESKHLAGAIAMPVLIGPGSISASVVIGEKLDPLYACLAVAFAVVVCLTTIALLKLLHDYVRPRVEALVDRYIEIAGRVMALVVGTIAVEMIMQGLSSWSTRF